MATIITLPEDTFTWFDERDIFDDHIQAEYVRTSIWMN